MRHQCAVQKVNVSESREASRGLVPWQRLPPHFTCGCVGNRCVCPVCKGVRLICRLSNREAWTEIKSSPQRLVLLSRGKGFCLMVSIRKKWCFVAGKGEWVRVKGVGHAKRGRNYLEIVWSLQKHRDRWAWMIERKRSVSEGEWVLGWKLDENKTNKLRWGEKIQVWQMGAKKIRKRRRREKREMPSWNLNWVATKRMKLHIWDGQVSRHH